MTEHNLFYCPIVKDPNGKHSLLKVAALYFNELVLLDLVRESWAKLDTPLRRANFRWNARVHRLKGEFGSFNEA